jgi:hypothetical protein
MNLRDHQQHAPLERAGPQRRTKTIVSVEPGIFRRVSWRTGKPIPWLWVHYPGKDGETEREPVKPRTKDVRKARKFRADRMAAVGRGEPGREAERVKVNQLLDNLVTDYEVNGRRSLDALKASVKALRATFGHLRAPDCTTPRIQHVQHAWLEQGVSPPTINRRCAALHRAFVLGEGVPFLVEIAAAPTPVV